LAVDLLPMDPVPGVEFVLGDFTERETLDALKAAIGDEKADVVMSDMAPNISGTRAVDQPRSMGLAEEALWFAAEALAPGGSFVVKLFQGEGFPEFGQGVRKHFRTVRLVKPKASRPESREIYMLARNYGM
jgi:23S rRNA (uridine2552-2'-O)-methyltransferase